jgi:hypothetical protein
MEIDKELTLKLPKLRALLSSDKTPPHTKQTISSNVWKQQ